MSEMKRKPYDAAVEKLIELTESETPQIVLAACDLLLKHECFDGAHDTDDYRTFDPSDRDGAFRSDERTDNSVRPYAPVLNRSKESQDRSLMPVPFFDNDDKAVFTTPGPPQTEDAEYEKKCAAALKSEIDRIEESRRILARLKAAKGNPEQSLSDFVEELLIRAF